MANRNTSPGIGETTDSGVVHNPQSSRAHTRTRVVRQTQTGIYINNNIPANHAHACAHARGGRRPFTQDEISLWREQIFAEGQEDPVKVAVYDKLYAEYNTLMDYFGRGGNDVMKRLNRIREENK